MPPAVLGVAEAGDIASGLGFAQYVEAEDGQSRLDAITRSAHGDTGGGVAYQVQYAFRRGSNGENIWLEDTGRWFAGADGKPVRALGVVREIGERHEHEQALTQLAKFDALTGEMNRVHLTEVLGAKLDEAVRFRGSLGFLLVAIDHLAHLNESYGFDIAEDVIAQVAKRIRARLRGKDYLGRFSGNKFGVILTACTAEELAVAADRLLEGVRDETIADRRRSGGGDGDDRRHHRAAPRPQRPGNSKPRAGRATCRAPQTPRLVRPLSAERRARRAAPRQRARDRRNRGRAQRTAHRARIRTGGRDQEPPDRILRMPDPRASPGRPHRACQ